MSRTPLAQGSAAEIWLIEQTRSLDALPQQYICKELRVGPECFQARHRGYIQSDSQNIDFDRIQRDFIRDLYLKTTQWKSVRHENIVQVFGLYKTGTANLVNLNVEFCANGTARQYINLHNHDPEIKNNMITDVLNGMIYLHTITPPIVHGCLNMDKIFVSEDGTTKIGEFGLAASTRSFALLAPAISHAGLSRWMSPELVDFNPEGGAPEPTTASDIWSLGCTMFEIASGELPYSKYKHELQVRRAIIIGSRPAYRPSEHQDELSIWSILESCWETPPSARPTVPAICLQYNALPQAAALFPVPSLAASPSASSSRAMPEALGD